MINICAGIRRKRRKVGELKALKLFSFKATKGKQKQFMIGTFLLFCWNFHKLESSRGILLCKSCFYFSATQNNI